MLHARIIDVVVDGGWLFDCSNRRLHINCLTDMHYAADRHVRRIS